MSKKRTEIDAIIQDFLTAIMSQGIKIDKYYFFGSHARGEAAENSDIDLIVVSRDFADMPDWQRWEILGKATAKVMEPIEALALTPEEINICLAREANFIRHILAQPETKEVQL